MSGAPSPTGDAAPVWWAWPFLIGRGRRVGYRLVVTPDFLFDARMDGLLLDAAGGEPTGPGELVRREIHTRRGQLTVLFRVVPATADGRRLRDGRSRPMYVTEGLVLVGRHPVVAVTPRVVEEVHRVATTEFHAFLASPHEARAPVVAEPMALEVGVVVRDAAPLGPHPTTAPEGPVRRALRRVRRWVPQNRVQERAEAPPDEATVVLTLPPPEEPAESS